MENIWVFAININNDNVVVAFKKFNDKYNLENFVTGVSGLKLVEITLPLNETFNPEIQKVVKHENDNNEIEYILVNKEIESKFRLNNMLIEPMLIDIITSPFIDNSKNSINYENNTKTISYFDKQNNILVKFNSTVELTNETKTVVVMNNVEYYKQDNTKIVKSIATTTFKGVQAMIMKNQLTTEGFILE